MSKQQIPGLQYPSWLNESDPQHAAIKNVFDNLFYLRGAIANISSSSLTPQQIKQVQQLVSETINNINNQITNNFTAAPFIITTHAIRLTTTPILGAALYEYDRNSFYVGSNSTGVILWTWDGGNMVDALANQPVDLGAFDKGFIFTANDAGIQTQYTWDGAKFVTVGGYLQSIKDAITNLVSTVFKTQHASSGVTAAGFGSQELTQLQSSTLAAMIDAAALVTTWSDATSANATSRWAVWMRNAGAALAEAFAVNTSFIFTIGSIYFRSGTAFLGQLLHANTGNRNYTLPDADGNITYENGGLTNNNFALGGGGALVKDAGFATVPLGSGGTGQVTAAAALAALNGVPKVGVTAHTITLAALTTLGTRGSITWNSDGLITGFVDPT